MSLSPGKKSYHVWWYTFLEVDFLVLRRLGILELEPHLCLMVHLPRGLQCLQTTFFLAKQMLSELPTVILPKRLLKLQWGEGIDQGKLIPRNHEGIYHKHLSIPGFWRQTCLVWC